MTTDRQVHLSTRSLSHRLLSHRFLSHRAWAVAEATALALVLWSAAVLAGVNVRVQSGGSSRPVGAAAVVVMSALAGLTGWGLLALLRRLVSRPRRWWTAIALVVLGLSLLGPLAEGVGTAATLTLLTMHLGVGAVLLLQLPGRD